MAEGDESGQQRDVWKLTKLWSTRKSPLEAVRKNIQTVKSNPNLNGNRGWSLNLCKCWQFYKGNPLNGLLMCDTK